VVVFPVLVLALVRLNRQYRAEASVLEMSHTTRPDLARYPRHRVVVFVDSVDLAEIEALRYANGLHADDLTAVHFLLDVVHADRLQQRWEHFDHDTPLRVIDCPDRHLVRAAHELVAEVLNDHKVTVLLPRRTYSPLVGRLLHDRTADKIARAVSRIPGAAAQIVPYDIESRIAEVTRAG
ncbi:DNA-binding protein, partial [Mycobacterium haemophilum DSM 44634]|nr:DNA-binding protein [Mycobacterium haemophilum DSM 44634]